MQSFARRNARPLKCSGRQVGAGGAGSAAAGGKSGLALPEPAHCRTCWECEDSDEGGRLVEPCACSGSMRYVHARCLTAWQQQLRASKGLAASRRCDVCKHAWAWAHQPPSVPTHWRQLLRDLGRTIPWSTLLECWRFSVLAVGTVQGMRAGVEGFRSGMRWATSSSWIDLEMLAEFCPEMALAAGAVPPLKVPMAVCLAAFMTGLAAQVAVVSMLCAYSSSVVGFMSGVTASLLGTISLGGSLLQQGTRAARALTCGALRGAAATGRVAAPLLLAMLRTLALSRLFA